MRKHGLKPPILFVVSSVGCRLALDRERCIEILGECGVLPTGPTFGVVDLLNVPKGLNAKEIEKYLRDHAAEICGFGTGGRAYERVPPPVPPPTARAGNASRP